MHHTRAWEQDLERRLDEKYREVFGRREVMAKDTEELDVDEILDEIEELEDADELDADDDPTVEAPAKKTRTRKSRKAKGDVKARKVKGEGGIGTKELAEAAGTDARSLRVLLRAEFPREEGGHYNWKSVNDPEAKAIIKRVRSGAVKEAQTEKLAELKTRKSTKKSTKKTPRTKKPSITQTKADRARARRARMKKEAAAAEAVVE
jgi:hypothetical protein